MNLVLIAGNITKIDDMSKDVAIVGCNTSINLISSYLHFFHINVNQGILPAIPFFTLKTCSYT